MASQPQPSATGRSLDGLPSVGCESRFYSLIGLYSGGRGRAVCLPGAVGRPEGGMTDIFSTDRKITEMQNRKVQEFQCSQFSQRMY